MTALLQWRNGFTLFLLLTLAVMGFVLKGEVEQKAKVNAALTTALAGLAQAETQRKLDVQVLAARQAENATQARKLADAQGALSEALQRNKVWSEASVPDDIQKALTRRSGGPDASDK